jgi:type I restriction enzyme R subunit
MVGADEEKKIELQKMIDDTMANTSELRSKRELIERFINANLPNITDASDVEQGFAEFISEEQVKAFREMCGEEGLDAQKTQALLDHYVSTGRIPRDHDLGDVLLKQPSVLLRQGILKRLKDRIIKFIDTFIEGI